MTRAAARHRELRPREFALLEYLMRHAGRVVSKTMILSHIWDYSFDPGTNVVDVLVYRLREKIDKASIPSCCRPSGASAMSSWGDALRRTLGLRLGPVVRGDVRRQLPRPDRALTYLLFSAALRQYDHEIIKTTPNPVRGGVAAGRVRRRSGRPSVPARRPPDMSRCSSGGRAFRGGRVSQCAERLARLRPLAAGDPELSGQQRWATLQGDRGDALEVL